MICSQAVDGWVEVHAEVVQRVSILLVAALGLVVLRCLDDLRVVTPLLAVEILVAREESLML